MEENRRLKAEIRTFEEQLKQDERAEVLLIKHKMTVASEKRRYEDGVVSMLDEIK